MDTDMKNALMEYCSAVTLHKIERLREESGKVYPYDVEDRVSKMLFNKVSEWEKAGQIRMDALIDRFISDYEKQSEYSGDICAEWVSYINAYRVYHESTPDRTIAYVDTLGGVMDGLQEQKIADYFTIVDDTKARNTEIEQHKQPKHRLYVDMDGTLAEFKVVTYQEQLFEERYFADLKPHENVVDAIKDIIENQPDIEVYVLSAYLTDSDYALDEKNEWLDRYIPEIDKEHRVFVPCGSDKKAVISNLSQADYLLDDYTENLLSWVPPGKAIKLINDINHTHGTWKEDCIRYDRDPSDISGLISDVVMGNTRNYDTKTSFDANHPSENEKQHKYDLVSQGILLETFDNKQKALEIAEKNNKKWLEYRQECMDNGEDYADNAMEVYEDGVLIADEYGLKNNDSSGKQHKSR